MSAIFVTSWIVPSTLLACVHVTRAVFSDSSGFRFSDVRIGEGGVGVGEAGLAGHHLMV